MTRTSRIKRFALWTAFLLLYAPMSMAEPPPLLRFDPFRPREEPVETSGKRAAKPAFVPVLLSTVVGGDHPLVNLGGELLGIGEEAKGYRLLHVYAFEALFEKDGKVVRIEIKDGKRMGQ